MRLKYSAISPLVGEGSKMLAFCSARLGTGEMGRVERLEEGITDEASGFEA